MPTIEERLYEHYSRHAKAPASREELGSRSPYLKRLISLHFPQNREARILDLGCGYGAVVHFAREAGYSNVEGVDASAAQVDVASRLGIEGVRCGDLMDVLRSARDASCDVVLAFDVLEHFHRQSLLGLVDEIHRVLSPGGRWILHVPNASSPFFGRVRYGDLTHHLAFTAGSLRQLLESSGFSGVETFEDTVVVHGLRSSIRALLWRLIRSTLRLYIAAETGEFGKDEIFTQNLLAVAYR